MFGFLKKLGKRSEPAPVLVPVPVAPEPPLQSAEAQNFRPAPRPPASALASSRTVMPETSSRPAPSAPAAPPLREVTPAPAAPAAQMAPVAAIPSAKPPPAIIVELSLKKLWSKLNPSVTKAASGAPDAGAFLRLPLPLLQAQLAKGSVKMPFVQLRQYSPPGLFPANPEMDDLEVEIPISEVLPLLKPEYFARRPNQRMIDVPDDIGPVFGPDAGHAHGLRVAEQKARSTAPLSAPNGAPVTAFAPPLPAAPVAEMAPTPAPALPVTPAALPVVPPASPAATPVSAVTPLAPAAAAPAPAIPVPPPRATIPVPSTVPLRNDPIPAPRLDPGLASLKPKAPQGNFVLALMDVAAYWSEKGQNELSNLYRHSLEIPMSTLESALKTGKLSFQWREVRPWVRLAPGNTLPTLADDLPVELPLSIVAPRFMEQRGLAKPKARADLTGDIPDVFEQKHPAPVSTGMITPPLGAMSVPMESLADLAAPSGPGKTGDTAFLAAAAGKPLLEFGEIFGQPDKKSWSMAEVAQKSLALRGVTGAIIGSSDGLLVAGSWSSGVKADSVAAFLPQMFGRLHQYSKDLLQLGEPGNFTIMIENVPLQIFKAGSSYFAVIGRAGENLPKAQLNAIATRLGTTTK